MSIFELNIFGFILAPTYYGLMYVLGFVFGYLVLKKRAVLNIKQLDDVLLYIFGGVILGGRLGYMLFYNTSNLLSEPLSLLRVWEGGMSFHGGVIGVVIAMLLFSRIHKVNFYKLADEVCLILPIGLFFGRIGNYLNGELLGFTGYNGPLAINGQFPSPLLEALLEGVVLFGILYYISKNKRFMGQIGCVFLIGYSVFRIFVELFFRQPDVHIGYILPYISLGTLLSIPMLIVGIILYFRLQKNIK